MVVVCAWFRQVFTGMAQHAPYFAEKDNIQGKIRNTKKEKRIYQKNRLNLEREKKDNCSYFTGIVKCENVCLSHFMLHHSILWYGTSERGAVVKFVKYR